MAVAKKGKITQENIVNTNYLKSKITTITFLDALGYIVLGTRKGEILCFDFMKGRPRISWAFTNEIIT
jgi:hypothetical protein